MAGQCQPPSPLSGREAVYHISGLRRAFYGAADVHIAVSTGMTLAPMTARLAVVWWVFKTGWKIRR